MRGKRGGRAIIILKHVGHSPRGLPVLQIGPRAGNEISKIKFAEATARCRVEAHRSALKRLFNSYSLPHIGEADSSPDSTVLTRATDVRNTPVI